MPGNHDWWAGYTVKAPLLSRGVSILENQAKKHARGDQHVWVVGVDDPYLHRDRLDHALSPINDTWPKILLAHAPTIYPVAAQHRIDLVLAGHTHGGQIRLPYVGALAIPGQDLFPRWNYGRYTAGKTTMIVNGGLGESMLPIRINNPPEIALITLISIHSA